MHDPIPIGVGCNDPTSLPPCCSGDSGLQVSPLELPSWRWYTVQHIVYLRFMDGLPLLELGQKNPERWTPCSNKPIPCTIVRFDGVIRSVFHPPVVYIPSSWAEHTVLVHPVGGEVPNESSECRISCHQSLCV